MTIRLALMLLAIVACGAGVRTLLARSGASSGVSIAVSIVLVLLVLGIGIAWLLPSLSQP